MVLLNQGFSVRSAGHSNQHGRRIPLDGGLLMNVLNAPTIAAVLVVSASWAALGTGPGVAAAPTKDMSHAGGRCSHATEGPTRD